MRYLRHSLRGQLLPTLRTVGQYRALLLQEGIPAVSRCLGRRQPRYVPFPSRPDTTTWLHDPRLPQRHADGLFPSVQDALPALHFGIPGGFRPEHPGRESHQAERDGIINARRSEKR